MNRYYKGNFKHYLHQSDDIKSISHNIISSFCEDKNGKLWIGTWGGGLNILDKSTNKFIRNPIDVNEFINDIFRDQQNFIWIGSNSGLYVYNSNKEKIIDLYLNENLTSTSINKIVQDKSGNYWIATWNGLNRVVINKNNFEVETVNHYKKDPENTNTLSENRIITLYIDTHKQLWIGTYGGGLNKMNFDENTRKVSFEFYNTENGLPGNVVYGILEDDHRNLWISTNSGLSKFNIDEEIFHNFDINDGLQENQFYWNAYAKSRSGKMYFGGINGLNIFHPDSIEYSEEFPKVVITDFLLFNKTVNVGESEEGRKILNRSITYTSGVELERKDYAFSIEFAALAYKSQSKIKYTYKLENFDPEWIQTDHKKRFATYSHLRPGNYIFKVRSTNADGVWNEMTTQLHIKIKPAYYETIWAFLAYGVIIIFLLVNFRNQILSRARYKHDIHLERIEKQNAASYNDLKLQFFTNISHEFKTPLTLILGPLDNLLALKGLDKYVKDQFKLMQNGGKRLLRLINQLMEFRKVETGNYKIRVSKSDIIPLIKETSLSFKLRSVQSKIKYLIHIPVKSATVWYDDNIIETIIYNLLSNAFKYTRDKGSISIHAYFEDKDGNVVVPDIGVDSFLVIKVSDTGVGIAKERLENVFKRFYQIEDTAEQKRGTGIGLALTKDLVEVHHGTISVNSELGKGTIFNVRIPVCESSYEKNELADINQTNTRPVKNENEWEEIILKHQPQLLEFKKPDDKNAPVILIVEDDYELIQYIGKILESKYQVLTSNNGVEGLETAVAEEPELIISDIMMPEMNGLELCEKVKTDIRISHIPVILLTALSSTDDMIKGYSTGADDYILKPFHQELFLVKVENIIEKRKQLRLSFQKKFLPVAATKSLPSVDEVFLKKILKFIEGHISEPEMNVETLGNTLSISTTHLYRKVKSLTGLSTNELIRKIRLKKASEILLEGHKSISQVMYEVGFSNNSYFAKCFNDEFGLSPKEYINKMKS